jgi:hypothetical protein
MIDEYLRGKVEKMETEIGEIKISIRNIESHLYDLVRESKLTKGEWVKILGACITLIAAGLGISVNI